ncbi:hypothetical protein DIPPA_26656 [Diplonema papillatum]|nr:hypothetical protein DIPPA_26656 [Diplonema papillatum]
MMEMAGTCVAIAVVATAGAAYYVRKSRGQPRELGYTAEVSDVSSVASDVDSLQASHWMYSRKADDVIAKAHRKLEEDRKPKTASVKVVMDHVRIDDPASDVEKC